MDTDNGPYTLTDGYFCSCFSCKTDIKEFTVQDNKYNKEVWGDKRIVISQCGDTILRIWSDDKDFTVSIGSFKFPSENYEVKLFEGGIPLIGQYQNNIYIYNSLPEKVYVEFENYTDEYRKKLSQIGDYEDAEGHGLKLHSNNGVNYQIMGKFDPGFSVNTIKLIN